MTLKLSIFLLFLTHFCNCEILRSVLSTIHDHWHLNELTLVYRNNPTLPGWPYFGVPRIQNLSSTGVDVAYLDLSRADLLTHIAVKTFPVPVTAFLALSIDEIKDILQMLLDPYDGHLQRMHERFELIISVPKLDYVTTLLADLYIPIYCQVYFIILPVSWSPPHLPGLYEVYHIPPYDPARAPLLPTMLAVRPGCSVPCNHEELWVRRKDLQGIQLQAGTTQIKSMVIVTGGGSGYFGSEAQATGFMREVWNELERLMNFSTVYRESVDSQWGARAADGQWSGLMGMLQRREIDVAIAGMTVTTERVRDADFIHAMHKNSYRLYFCKYSSVLSLESMSLLTPWQILVTVLASVVVATLAQVVALHYSNDEAEETSSTFTMEVVFFYNFYAICQQGTNWGNALRTVSGKINLWLVYFCGLVVFNIFSATMISRLAVSTRNVPFESMEELIQSEKYQILTQKGTADFEVLKSILKNSGLNISSHLASEQPNSQREGVSMVCSGNFAFWTTMELPDLIAMKTCTPLCLVTPYINSLSMAMAKGLPYQQMFNNNLQKMMEAGTLSSIRHRWFPESEEVPNEPGSIELHQAVPLFLWITMGLLVSFALLIAEIYAFKRAQAAEMRKIRIIAGRNTDMLLGFYRKK